MSQIEAENLSALMDGELSGDEVRFLLRRSGHDVSMAATWTRYHYIGAALRRDVVILAEDDFADQVMQSVHGPGQTAARARGGHRWLRWSAGGAIAAGVAVLALTMLPSQVAEVPALASHAEPISMPVQTQQVATAPVATPAPSHIPSVPRWLSRAPAAARWAQAAAADAYPGLHAGAATRRGGYGSQLAPYMTLPAYRAPVTRQARQMLQQFWLVTPSMATGSSAPPLPRVTAQ